MADKAISDLTQALQITNEDLFVLEQSGEAKKLKGATLLDFVTLSVVSVTVTTLPAGSSATATYDKSTGTLALGIPQGGKGDTGATGATGPANVLTIGSVTSGKVSSATITGEAPNQVLNLVLEKGEKGDKGDKGEKGNAFTYADFTPDQLAALKGEKGDTGSQGEPGPPGKDGITPEIVEGELVEVPSAGGGTDLSLGITGAQVGQIAKITAVDTDGKPTAWEPVEMTGGEVWEKIADVALAANTRIYDVASFGVYRKVKVLMSRAAYVSGLNENVWFRIVKTNAYANTRGISEVYMTVEYGYLTWEVNAEFGSTFSYVSKNMTNNRYSPDSVRQTVAVPVGILDPNDYKLRIEFQNGGKVIQDGDTIAVYGVKR